MIAKILCLYIKALYGKITWDMLCRIHSNAECFFILNNTPENADVTHIALKHYDNYIKKNKISKVAIIYSRKSGQLKLPENIEAVSLSKLSLSALFDYYSLCDISKKAVFCDLAQIKGRDGMELDGVKGITIEQIVKIGILNLDS